MLNNRARLLRDFSVEAYMRLAGTEAVPFSVHQQLASRTMTDHNDDMFVMVPDFVECQDVMQQRACAAAIRAGTRPAQPVDEEMD